MINLRDVIQGVIDDLHAVELCAGSDDFRAEMTQRSAARAAEKLASILDCVPLEPFDKRCADALADEVDLLVRRKVIDSRSPAADALLCYRDPPTSPRSDRLLDLVARNAELQIALVKTTQETSISDKTHDWSEQRKQIAAKLEELREQFREIRVRLEGMEL